MTMKSISSVITTMPKAQSSKTSTEHSSTGYEIALSGTQTEQAIKRQLEVNNPTELDKSLVSSMESILGSPIRIRDRIRYPQEGGMTVELIGIDIPKDADLTAIERARVATTQSMVGLPIKELEKRLAMLMTLLIKPAQENIDDVSVRIKALATELSKHPADITIQAIESIKRSNKWWPTYSEFYERIAPYEQKRKLLMLALNKKHLELTA